MEGALSMRAIEDRYTKWRVVGLFIEWRDTESVFRPELRGVAVDRAGEDARV